jgi:DNA modification methylase
MPQLQWNSKRSPGEGDGARAGPASLTLDSIIYPGGRGYPDGLTEDHLFLGDNLGIMEALLPEYEGCLDLIYADPPFFTNKRYPARIGRGEDSRRPQDWELSVGYADHWRDLDSYLDFLYLRLKLMHRLLSRRGTLYLHLDWHADAYARLLLDEIFGPDRLLNEIIWVYHGPSPIRRAFNRKHDTILVYVKTGDYIFNADAVREPYHPSTVKTFGSSTKAGFGKAPDLERGKVPEDWWYFPVVARLHRERTGYPTQKPEALLERILLASSDPGSRVADFFCGSGPLPAAAARHGRGFLAADLAWRAVHTTRSRLIEAAFRPFSIHRESAAPLPAAGRLGQVRVEGELVRLEERSPLDYWEVDPAWDGTTFRSAAQARRPNRSAEIPLEIKTPVAPGKVCVRAVRPNGELLLSHV